MFETSLFVKLQRFRRISTQKINHYLAFSGACRRLPDRMPLLRLIVPFLIEAGERGVSMSASHQTF